MTFVVRKATRDDFREFLISAEALVATDAGKYDTAATSLNWAKQAGARYFSSLLDNDDNLAIIASDGEDLIGHLVGRLSGPGSVHPIRVAELESIYVDVSHRSQGVGHGLMTEFLAWASHSEAQRVTVTAYVANDGAQRFYARYRFAPKSIILDLDLK